MRVALPNAGSGCEQAEQSTRRMESTIFHGDTLPADRRGTVMLVCVFVAALTSMMIIGILDSLSIQAATVSTVEGAEQASYTAEAGVQHALSVLKTTPAWTGRLRWSDAKTSLANGHNRRRYVVTVSVDASGNPVITSTGYFNNLKKIRVIVLSGRSV